MAEPQTLQESLQKLRKEVDGAKSAALWAGSLSSLVSAGSCIFMYFAAVRAVDKSNSCSCKVTKSTRAAVRRRR